MIAEVMMSALALGGCGAVACQPAPAPAALPVCTTEQGYMVDGHLVVTVLQNEAHFPCDLTHGMQLNLVYNEETEGAEWGGDASVEWAAQNCADHGGREHWFNDGEYRLVCEDVDF